MSSFSVHDARQILVVHLADLEETDWITRVLAKRYDGDVRSVEGIPRRAETRLMVLRT